MGRRSAVSTQFEHTSAVLHFEKSNFSSTRSGVLQGLAAKSEKVLSQLGGEGWELVSAIPYIAVSALALRQPGTDAALGSFKRTKT